MGAFLLYLKEGEPDQWEYLIDLDHREAYMIALQVKIQIQIWALNFWLEFWTLFTKVMHFYKIFKYDNIRLYSFSLLFSGGFPSYTISMHDFILPSFCHCAGFFLLPLSPRSGFFWKHLFHWLLWSFHFCF